MPRSVPARLGLLLVAGLTLAGCTTAGDFVRPDFTLPKVFASAAPAKTPVAQPQTPWWKAFGDPLLDRLVEDGLAANLDIGQAIERVAAARATAHASNASDLPQVSGTGTYTRAGGAGNTSGVTESSSATGDVSWELDLFGKYRSTRASGRASIAGAEEDVNAARLSLIGDVATNYVEARGYQARLAISRSTLASRRQTLQLTRNKFEGGAGTALDVAQAEGEVASTAADIPSLETSYRAAVFSLGVLLGRTPDSLLAQLNKAGPVPRPRLTTGTGIPADLIRNRPDIRKAERTLAGAVADVGIAQADLYPSLTLSGSLEVSATNLVKAAAGSWSFGPVLDLPIFDAGKRRFTLAAKQATARELLLAYKATVLDGVKEVENAATAYLRQQRRRTELARSVTAYRTATDLSRDLYRNGSQDFLDFLSAERSLFTSQDSLAQSDVALATDFITLNKAVGGGWSASDHRQLSATKSP